MTGEEWAQELNTPFPWFLDPETHHELEVSRIMYNIVANRADARLEAIFNDYLG